MNVTSKIAIISACIGLAIGTTVFAQGEVSQAQAENNGVDKLWEKCMMPI